MAKAQAINLDLRKVFTTKLLFLLMIFFICPKYADGSDNLKIAVVDVQYVIDNSDAVLHLRQSIDKISEKLHKEMSDKEVSLKDKESEILNKKSQISKAEFDKMVNSFYKEVSIVQHDTQQKKAKLEQAHADSIAEIHRSVLKIIAELAKDKGFNIVLPISQILYTDDYLLVTDDVIKLLNESMKHVELKFKY